MKMAVMVVTLLVGTPVSAVEWQPVADTRNTAATYAVARAFPGGNPAAFDEDEGTDGSYATATNFSASATSQISSSLFQIGNEKIVAGAIRYEASAEADVGTPHSWGEAGATLRRVQVYEASEDGIMKGKIHAQVPLGLNVPENCQTLGLEIRVGKSVAEFHWYGHLERWYLTGIRLWNVDENGVEQLIDLGWMQIYSEGFTSLAGAPFTCSENVVAGEKVAVEVNINSLPSWDLRAEASTEPGEQVQDIGKLHIIVTGGLIQE